ncbi:MULTISPECIES: dienelactone hydrolase family protein [unclassified Pantoea]|uniref:dienelactone hydrolase family protein n=1 Tax=unclassified Pantoea TaxID=2630326 RepID=UPI001CD36A99|nr:MULTISPECIES: dienelactone hydrolase family protein [unclassified Pantoea]MCA1179494.1 dienelactone hydrolase family protein [Pantoea sp. alder69]MCA1251747.1 dienelactone hydrolase family protein [Pantoea sp. alder70]MCA1267916.1 dienelactone hydrolase family protein [Pantoea sp. alder81]
MIQLAEEHVNYTSGKTPLTGAFIYDVHAPRPMPGIVMAPNMMGITASNIAHAERLASEGYAVLVADLYGVAPSSSDEASSLMHALKDSPEERYRMRAALKQLSSDPRVDGNKIAAVGFCYGGHCVLELARSGVAIRAVFSVHGTLDTLSPAKKGQLPAKVVVLNGAADPFVSAEQIGDFSKEMAAAEADFMFINYRGAVHSFTYPRADVTGKMEYNENISNRAFNTILGELHRAYYRMPTA